MLFVNYIVIKNIMADFYNFNRYFYIVDKFPILTLNEEKIFLLKLKNDNDALAAHYLIISHLRYVVKIAKDYLCYGFFLSDLVQEGSVGLLKSLKKYDLTKNVRFVSFAVYWIKAEIFNYVLKNLNSSTMVDVNDNKVLLGDRKSSLFQIKQYTNNDLDTLFNFNFYKEDFTLTLFFHFFKKKESFFFVNSFDDFDLKCIFKYLVFEVVFKFGSMEKMIFLYRWFYGGDKYYFKNVPTLKFFSFYYCVSSECIRKIELKVIKKIKTMFKFFL